MRLAVNGQELRPRRISCEIDASQRRQELWNTKAQESTASSSKDEYRLLFGQKRCFI
jgi:hypothetical protein